MTTARQARRVPPRDPDATDFVVRRSRSSPHASSACQLPFRLRHPPGRRGATRRAYLSGEVTFQGLVSSLASRHTKQGAKSLPRNSRRLHNCEEVGTAIPRRTHSRRGNLDSRIDIAFWIALSAPPVRDRSVTPPPRKKVRHRKAAIQQGWRSFHSAGSTPTGRCRTRNDQPQSFPEFRVRLLRPAMTLDSCFPRLLRSHRNLL
jgi:hypothetical protein